MVLKGAGIDGVLAAARRAGDLRRPGDAALASLRLAAGVGLTCAASVTDVEGAARAAAGPAAVRHRHRRADHPAARCSATPRRPTCKNVPIVVVDARPVAGEPRADRRFDASPNFTVVGTRDRASARSTRGSSAARAWMALAIPPDYGDAHRRAARPATVQVIADGTDANSTSVAMGYARNLDRRATPGAGGASGCRGRPDVPAAAIERAHPRLVQPAAREPRLHDPGHRRAAAAGDHDEPVVDGDRAREGARHARAAERHAARAAGS